MRITLTRELAYAAATDAANRQMRKAGRMRWNKDDYNLAASEFERLWPIEAELAAQRQVVLREALRDG